MMKKILLTVACAAACFTALPSLNAYAASTEGKDPGSKTTEAVHQDFPQAKQIRWTQEGENFVATFNMFESKITAMYDSKGKLLSTLILLSGKDIPFAIRTKLAQNYPGYQVYCVKEYLDKETDGYFFILKQQDGGSVNWLSIKSNGRDGFIVLQRLKQHA